MDDLPGRTSPRGGPVRGGGKPKPGGQPGSPGSYLAWRRDPDEVVPHLPDGTCGCGAPLSAAADLGVVASHQLVELPLSLARVTQHDLHAVACGCGRVHRAAPPPGAGRPGTVSYGPQLQAWCVYLIVAHAVPVHRCAELIGALTGAKPSPGFVHGMLARARRRGRRAEQADPGAGHLVRCRVRRRDPDPCRTGAKIVQALPAGCLHQAADLLPAGRPEHEDLRRVRAPGPGRLGGRARPVPEL